MVEKYKIEDYGAIFDAHVHTYFDFHDGMISPEQLVNRTKKLGFNFVNAMSHDNVRGIKKIKKLARGVNLPVITSMEVSTGYNHLLAFGVQEWDLAKDCWNPEIIIEKLREQNCAIYISHPGIYIHKGYWTPEIVKRLDVDGIEWINGSNYHFNKRTWNLFKNYPKGKIAGTDAHHFTQMGYTFTQADINSEDPDDLVEALKKGKCRPLGRFVPLHRFILYNFLILIKRRLFPTYEVEGKWINPHREKMGVEPKNKFISKKWKEEILNKPIITHF